MDARSTGGFTEALLKRPMPSKQDLDHDACVVVTKKQTQLLEI